MTLLLDFDGTLNPGPYANRYECTGEPTPEAKAAVQAYREAGIEVIIFTARLADLMPSQYAKVVIAVRAWTRKHFDDWEPVVTCVKHPGVILDDNAIRFSGVWPTVEQIQGHGTFTSPDDYVPEPDWKQAFMDAMRLLNEYGEDAIDDDLGSDAWAQYKALCALRDAAKGETNG